MRGLGAALAYLYAAFHSYPVAIVLLTLGVRALLLPLTIKSTRSMAAMQKAQPDIKRVQNKYKELQKKARDRQEIQQMRLEMNREMQEVMRAHGASFSGGCLPTLAQFPVLIAMFAVMRVAIPVVATPVSGPLPADTFGETKNLRSTICRPVDSAGQSIIPSNSGSTPTMISCPLPDKTRKTYELDTSSMVDPHNNAKVASAPWISVCQPVKLKGEQTLRFACRSALGTGHLPKDSKLFRDVEADRATLFGMHPGCTATQVGSKDRVEECTTDPHGGGAGKALPYYALILIVLGTSYYSARQLNQRTLKTGGQITPQQQMMARITPLFFGFISLNLPAGANLYFLVQNFWQIGQQHVQFTIQDRNEAAQAEKPKPESKPERKAETTNTEDQPRQSRPQQGSKKKKKRRRR